MSNEFLGRDYEIAELDRLYDGRGFKFAVVYGRRRIGKSALIQRFISIGNKPNISFMALEQNDILNLASFSEAVLNKFGTAKSFLSTFSSWEKAFDYIVEQAKNESLVLFIDEYPYLANANASISSILQKYADGAFKNTNITLILCGSSMSFMENQVLGHKSPLYGRRNMQFKVEPFDYYDSAKFFDNFSNVDKAMAYAVTGGIPQYLDRLNDYPCIADGIKNEFLKKNGSLYEEPRNLLLQELREPAVYNAIIRAIAGGASRQNEIALKSGEDSKKVSRYLSTLISLHLIKKEFPVVGGQERNGIYRLSDSMFRFWYKFVVECSMLIEAGMFEHAYEQKILPYFSEYMGLIFEDICIEFLKRQNKKLKLPIVFDNIGRWWGNNPIEKCQEEIDVLATSGSTAVFGECKWKDLVGLEVLSNLKRKSEIFKQFDKKLYFVFSKGGFTDALKEAAQNDDTVRLVDLGEIYA